MTVPRENPFWSALSSFGRNPVFASPDELWAAACEYFSWVEDNPLHEPKPFAYQGEVSIERIPRMRAMSLDGLLVFLDIDRRTWTGYAGRDGFSTVAGRIERVIRVQKFEGAAADLLNPVFIARDLAATPEPAGGATEPEEHSARDLLASRIAGIAARLRATGGAGGTE